MPHPRLVLSLAIVGLLALPAAGLAQARLTGADLEGTVVDQTGAALTATEVSVTNVETNVGRRTVTDERGRYSVPALPPGRYVVSVSRPGFRTLARESVLSLGQSATMDFTLEVAPLAEDVTVRDDTPAVQVNRTELS